MCDHPQVLELCRLLGTDVTSQLEDCISSAGPNISLKVEASICSSSDAQVANEELPARKLLLGYIDLNTTRAQSSSGTIGPALNTSPSQNQQLLTPADSVNGVDSDESDCRKRRKVVGGLRLRDSARGRGNASPINTDSDLDSTISKGCRENASCRQVHSDTRFPQRKPPEEPIVPTMEPTSGDKLISGIWRQIFSEIQLTTSNSVPDATINVRGVVDREAFHAINTICMKYYSLSHSARATEMIVQAYWVECYEARIVALKIEKPFKSATEIKMEALKEACAAFHWKEKELRNKLSIWRGYRDIKEAGGWVSLVFASSGVYRFCKYRAGFDENLITRLRQLRSSFELAADTLHPEWRQLLDVISQSSPPRYIGHPHQWVVTRDGERALPLYSTYRHIPNFNFRLIEESEVDMAAFGDNDPRRTPGIDPYYCLECGLCQSNTVQLNRCMCFPSLYGSPRSHPPVQIFQTSNGKNNGLVSRGEFERGTAIAEFVGEITNGIDGMDVMIAGPAGQYYQIYQGHVGNFTRFINHSCRPNCQFQTFYWLGVERILVVSRGVSAGSEITVDYSDHYWKRLDKECLCGETCCRYSSRSDKG